MKYFLGAYHLIQLKPLDLGLFKGRKVLTGSSCINISCFDPWSLSWTEDGKKALTDPKGAFSITTTRLESIQAWADEKFNEKRLGWPNTFHDLETLKTYKSSFFAGAQGLEVIGVYFPEASIPELVQVFEPKSEQAGEIGILQTLKCKIPENSLEEAFIGYDLIGMEFGGDYHSFHCYDLAEELMQKFKLSLNEHGLIEACTQKEELMAYANTPEESGLPFIPWYLVKVKRVTL